MRLAARKDANHDEIADAWRKCGWTVHDTFQLGGGFPDLVAAKRGVNILVEVKDPAQPPSKRYFTRDQKLFHALWPGPIYLVETVQQVLDIDSAYSGRLRRP